jgi:hypothetical protein
MTLHLDKYYSYKNMYIPADVAIAVQYIKSAAVVKNTGRCHEISLNRIAPKGHRPSKSYYWSQPVLRKTYGYQLIK